MMKAESQGSAAYAVLYECLCTVTKIYPSPQLVEMAASSVGRFLEAENNNLKYLGITALVAVVQVNPAYASEHQMVVIDCLSDPDETLKRKTLELLCKMCNPDNVVVIVDKLIEYVKSSVDPYVRKDLVPRIVQIAERFAPDNQWFFETTVALFEHAGDLVPAETLNNLLGLIANPDSGDDAEDEALRVNAFEVFMELLERPKVPDILTHAMCWVIGEYAYLGEDYDQDIIMEMLVGLLSRTYADNFETKGWVLSALTKMVAQNNRCPAVVQDEVTKLKSSLSANLQQRAYELERLLQNPVLMRQVLPLDASSDDIEVDPGLPFLDGVVQQALAAGAKAYMPPSEREQVVETPTAIEETDVAGGLRFEAYSAPSDVHASIFAGTQPDNASAAADPEQGGIAKNPDIAAVAGAAAAPPGSSSPSLQVKARRWGKQGDSARKPAEAGKPAAPQTSLAAVTARMEAAAGASSTVAEEPVSEPEIAVKPDPVVEKVSKADEPAPSPELQRKAELAASIFGAPSGSSRTQTRTSRARKRPGAAAKAPSKVQGSGLLGGATLVDTSTAAVPAAIVPPDAPAPAPAASATTGDLLGDIFGGGQSAPEPAAPTPVSTTVDLLGGLDLSAAPATATAPPPGSMLPSTDLLGDAASVPVTAAPATTGDLLGDLFGAGAPAMAPTGAAVPALPVVPADLKAFPHAESGEICSHEELSVTCTKVYKPSSLVAVLFFANKTTAPKDAAVQLTVTPELIPSGATTTSYSIQIGPSQCSHVVLEYSCGGLTNQMQLSGQVTIAGRNMPFNVRIEASDLVRSFPITTETYGG